jgi:hypothetical protein
VFVDYTYDVIQQVKNYSQIRSAKEEKLETVNDRNCFVLQNILEDDLPLHRVEASFDMG